MVLLKIPDFAHVWTVKLRFYKIINSCQRYSFSLCMQKKKKSFHCDNGQQLMVCHFYLIFVVLKIVSASWSPSYPHEWTISLRFGCLVEDVSTSEFFYYFTSLSLWFFSKQYSTHPKNRVWVCVYTYVWTYVLTICKPKQTNFAVHESPYDTVIPFMT